MTNFDALLATYKTQIQIQSPANSPTIPKALPERGGARFMDWLFPKIGSHAAYMIAPVVVLFFFLSGPNSRASVGRFYQHLGVRSRFRLFWLSYLNHLYFSASLIDRMAMAHGRAKFRVVKAPGLNIASLPERSIVVGSHLGDWTLCSQAFTRQHDRPIGIIVDLQANPKFQEHILSKTGSAVRIIDASRSGIEVILGINDALTSLGQVCFLGDRISKNQRLQTTDFFSAPATFPLSAYETALRFGCPVYTFFCIKQKLSATGDYFVWVDEIWDGKVPIDAGILLERYVKRLSTMTRRFPASWFNFHDFWSGAVAER